MKLASRPAVTSLVPISLSLLLAACSDGTSELPDTNQSGPVRVASNIVEAQQAALPGTPMNERVAVIGLLNKRNGITRDLSMKPGEALRVGDAIVRLRACETAAPWETQPETGAFVQLDVLELIDRKWHRAFSGWLFKERPERNVVQHAIYDVWVKSCTMTWPEVGPDTVGSPGSGEGKRGGNNTSSASNAAETPAEPGDTENPRAPSNPPRSTPSTAAPSNDR